MQNTQGYFIPLTRLGLKSTSAQLELRRKTPIGQDLQDLQDYTGFTGCLSFLNLLRPITP